MSTGKMSYDFATTWKDVQRPNEKKHYSDTCLEGSSINLSNLSGYYMYTLLKHADTLHSDYKVCLCFTWFTQQTATVSLNNTNRLVFAAET
jgi:hypothetical protein